MKYRVTGIIDGDTLIVDPCWTWRGKIGNRVRPIGYNTPEVGETGHTAAKNRLENLTRHRHVELTRPVSISHERLVCEVTIFGNNLADYFPEYHV